MKHMLSVIAVMAALSGVSVSAHAQRSGTGGGGTAMSNWKAIASGALEVPPNASPGNSIVTIDVSGQQMFVELPFRDLEGTTAAAHIHCCTSAAFTGTAPVAVPFTGFPQGVHAGTYTNAIPLGATASYDPAFLSAHGGTAQGASTALLDAIAANEAYVNIHTSSFPNGEIRGWIVAAPVPEPGEWAMLGGGLAALLAMGRRRRS